MLLHFAGSMGPHCRGRNPDRGGGLLLGGKRKPGLVAAAAGVSLAALDQQDTILSWWNDLPSTSVMRRISSARCRRL